jgi:hypothetical protein
LSTYKNNFLFSETFIKDFISKNKKRKSEKEFIISKLSQLRDWHKEYTLGDYSDDPWEEFVEIILDMQGFQKESNNGVSVLYTNTISETEKPVAICYIISKDKDIGSINKGNYFAFNAVNSAKNNNVEWAFLTNGYRWRLYNTKNVSPYENYLEVDLEESIKDKSKPGDAFYLFYYLFNSQIFYIHENNELYIETLKAQSDTRAEMVEDSLRGKTEEILKVLCYGLIENMKKSNFTDQEKKDIYHDAIILLYRMLFFGYAESRELLPIIENDPEYTTSFKKLCEEAKEIYESGKVHKIKDNYDFWDRFDNHLRIYVDKSYNGGLFRNDSNTVLKEHRIANGHFIKCLVEIAYNSDKKGNYSHVIEYKDLSVRNLGSIYEGLLEYQLFIAKERMVQKKGKGKGKVNYIPAREINLKNSDLPNIIEEGGIYLSQDALERKDSGSYYTPEDVVEYIINKTIGEKTKKLKIELDEKIAPLFDSLSIEPSELAKTSIRRQIDEMTINFIEERILSLSIIDSAMGSGHFLVNATYKVANEIVNIINKNNWLVDDDVCADIGYWKRRVLENCIYGVDVNGLAVTLSRLSLWLISASSDKALSFIDHHLKEGNSIIGATREQVELITDKQNLSIFDVLPTEMIKPILDKYDRIKEIGSKTRSDVEEQKELYSEIESELKLLKLKYDYFLANQYLETENMDNYSSVMQSQSITSFYENDINDLINFATKEKFFHWELEFPEVFKKGGFDISIGNPPYVEADAAKYFGVIKTKKSHNLYAFLLEKNMNYMNDDGYLGVILPSASVCTPRMDDFQKMLIDGSKKISFATFDDRPGKLFTRLESIRAAIILMNLGNEETKEVLTTKYIRFYSEERKRIFENINYSVNNHYNLLEGIIPKIGQNIENSIINKVFSSKKSIGDHIFEGYKPSNTVYYGYGVRYWIKAMNNSASYIDEGAKKSSGEKEMAFDEKYNSKVFCAILNSSLFFWFFTLFSDCRNLTRTVISSFPFDYNKLSNNLENKLIEVSELLMDDYIKHSIVKNISTNRGELTYREYRVKKGKNIIDEIDLLLADYFQLSKEEVEFITNYELNFRIGRNQIEDE